ncbi:hypothetical protein GA0061071_107214 [Kosakonia oryzendophytica]|uniref:Uncharacterized protein n=1 Tax=Kosakonia oryzendophytica TaxID=1005665 RepID=A0A1C4CGA4_9ENTR|nr:hypothetical protein [Kosakonia oryzendophytica]AMO49822.1 Hypothetical protein AKI40_3442 [Enterobacter sp. FY-07]TDT59305.1 hypothetical protein DFO53_0876 [Enterobacter sp. AG5470]WBT60252.1 hypothetical protein O9K67_10995 [Kosakonia oryzendophytica]SCC18119.1 hypothetical protein GA0061071_107214 [Kosakonia oryzendophytica]
MQNKLKRVRNVLVNQRASAEVGWLIQDEFAHDRLYKPFVTSGEASNSPQLDEEHVDLRLDPVQQYLVTTMANRKQPGDGNE